MKKKTLTVLLLSVLLVALAFFRGDGGGEETWLRIEESGVSYELAYLHRLVEEVPTEAGKYLAKPISFVAPISAAEQKLKLPYYGKIESMLIFSAGEGKEFWVQSPDVAPQDYIPGELLRVSGRITSLSARRIMLLNCLGTPGYPNEIKIERIRTGE